MNSYLDKNGVMITGAIMSAAIENILILADGKAIARISIVNVDFDY